MRSHNLKLKALLLKSGVFSLHEENDVDVEWNKVHWRYLRAERR